MCPGCGTWSSRAHGSYLRFPADVLSPGRSVLLRLKVRRFTCQDAACVRRTSWSRFPGRAGRAGRPARAAGSGRGGSSGCCVAETAGGTALDVVGVQLCLEFLDDSLGDGDVGLELLNLPSVRCGVDLSQVGIDPPARCKPVARPGRAGRRAPRAPRPGR
ncbi:hypothetical protein OG514_33020 [Streptomyces sp. NBC_00572]|nr:hypothetical protein [Streptomyces sp. NBC_00572]